jgi:hypothetical protein
MIYNKFATFITNNKMEIEVTQLRVMTEYEGVKAEDIDKFLSDPRAAEYIWASFVVNQFSLKKKNASRITVKGAAGLKNLRNLKECQDLMQTMENELLSAYNRVVDNKPQSIRGALVSKIIMIFRLKLIGIYTSVYETYPGVAKAFTDVTVIYYLRFKNAQIWAKDISILLGNFSKLPLKTGSLVIYDVDQMGHENVRAFIIRRCARAMANNESSANAGAMFNKDPNVKNYEWAPNATDVVIGNVIIAMMMDTGLKLGTENDKTTLKKLKKTAVGSKFSYPVGLS